MQTSHQQIDDVQDAIDIVGLIHAAAELYPTLVDASGTSGGVEDVLAEIACDRHCAESVARFRDDPVGLMRRGELIDLGPISAASFAVILSALDAVASAGHALDQLNGKRL